MPDPVSKLLKNVRSDISQETRINLSSKKIKLLDHTVLPVKSTLKNEDLTDMAMENGMSKSQLSRLDNRRSYQVFVEIFYSLVYPYIMLDNLSVYGRYLSIMGINSTFIRTRIRESGKYRRQKTKNWIKMHSATITFPFTLPIESVVTSANLNDSLDFDEILSSMDQNLLGESILTFDVGYYDLEKFRGLKNRNIMFVTRIKRNARYDIIREYAHSKIIRFRNGIVMRLVSLMIEGKQRDYLTDIRTSQISTYITGADHSQ